MRRGEKKRLIEIVAFIIVKRVLRSREKSPKGTSLTVKYVEEIGQRQIKSCFLCLFLNQPTDTF